MSEPSSLPLASPTGEAPSQSTIWLLVAAATFAAGAMYYSQPLLGKIAHSFGISELAVGSIPSLAQLGYVLGLIFITPLGDALEKRGFVVTLLGLLSAAFFAAAAAPTAHVFSVVAVLIGMAAVVTQVLIPFVAVLSPPEKRSENLGNVISGALVGVLASRTLSGFLGEHLGWRSVFGIAGAVLLLMTVALWTALPPYQVTVKYRYFTLIGSLGTLVRDLPYLRSLSLVGAFMYAALCSFWTPLAFYMQQHFNEGPATAGAFGVLGVVGALAAKLIGRHADRLGTRRVVRGSIALMGLAFIIFALGGGTMAGMVAGVLLLDLGAQAATVSNQAEIYTLHPHAQTRLNTIYKICYFLGGSLGTVSSAFAWAHAGWPGVCVTGLLYLMAGGVAEMRNRVRPAPTNGPLAS